VVSKYEKGSKICKALAHPVRLRIAQGILKDECNVGSIQKKLGLPQSTISQHLAILRNGGVIEPLRKGNTVCHRITNDNVRQIVELVLGKKEQ
jgi:DNA-binding transcriptional ArsR family regulator